MSRQLGYGRILVPVAANVESERAMDAACRLARRGAGSITAVAIVEVPATLPLDAHMKAEEQAAHHVLERHAAIADSYGVRVTPRLVRGRTAGRVVVEQAELRHTELIVIGAPGRRHRRAIFGNTVEHVLKRARCRVMFIGSSAGAERIDAAA
jgi:nucleotide-binding universal stress UspA family protein